MTEPGESHPNYENSTASLQPSREHLRATVLQLEDSWFKSGDDLLTTAEHVNWIIKNHEVSSSDKDNSRIEDYMSACQEAEEQGQSRPRMEDWFSDTVTTLQDAFHNFTVHYDNIYDSRGRIKAALQPYAAEKAADVLADAKQIMAELERTVDFTYVANMTVDARNPHCLHALDTIRNNYNLLVDPYTQEAIANGQISYIAIATTGRRIRADREVVRHYCAAYKLPTDEHGLPTNAIESSGARLNEVCTDITERTSSADAMYEKFRLKGFTNDISTSRIAEFCRQSPTAHAIPQLAGALVQALGRMDLPVHDYAPNTESPDYRAFVETARAIDPLEAAANIAITGELDSLPFEFSEAELREYLIATAPPLALKAIKLIEFRALTADEDEYDKVGGNICFDDDLGGYRIVIDDEKIRKEYPRERWAGLTEYMAASLDIAEPDELTGLINVSQNVNKSMMLEILSHEVGHAFHSELPAGALEDWNTTTTTDSTRITLYVKQGFDNNHPYRHMEDFAESGRYFVQLPEVLEALSKPRFEAIRRLNETFMPLYAANVDSLKSKQDKRIARHGEILASVGMTKVDFALEYLTRHAMLPTYYRRDEPEYDTWRNMPENYNDMHFQVLKALGSIADLTTVIGSEKEVEDMLWYARTNWAFRWDDLLFLKNHPPIDGLNADELF